MDVNERKDALTKLVLASVFYGLGGAVWLYMSFLFSVMGAGSGMGKSFSEILVNWVSIIFMLALPSFILLSVPIAWYFYVKGEYQKTKRSLVFFPGITGVLFMLFLFGIIFRGFLEGIRVL